MIRKLSALFFILFIFSIPVSATLELNGTTLTVIEEDVRPIYTEQLFFQLLKSDGEMGYNALSGYSIPFTDTMDMCHVVTA